MNSNPNLINMSNYRHKRGPVLALFNTNNVSNTHTNIVNVYRFGSNQHCIIRIKNNRMYRVVGPNLIEILTHNIPTSWVCVAVFKGLTEGNLKALYNSFIGNK
jgi:hypothetical protein